MNPLTHLDKAQPAQMSDEPVIVLNLLKFKSAESQDSYLDYAASFFKTFGARGAEALYCGKLMEKVQGDAGDWDIVILVRYTNRKMFYDMLRSEEYQAFSYLREDALENAVLQPSEAVMPYRTESIEFEGGDWLGEIQKRLAS
ncbi:DUF1330 domain-containing protein [Halioglobus maricola]|nr:DUF1330 domain-containing protein [Halioglobus maricola]